MNKKTFNLISLLISIIFTLSIIYFITGIIANRKSGPQRTEDIFKNLIEKTSLAAMNYSLNSNNFSEEFLKAAGDFKNYNMLQMKVDEKLIYSYPANNSVHTKNRTKAYKQSFTTKDNSIIEIEAEIFTSQPSSLFQYARTTFIIIFITTVCALLILIFVKPDSRKENSDENIFSYEDDFKSKDEKIVSKIDESSEETNNYELTSEEREKLFGEEINFNDKIDINNDDVINEDDKTESDTEDNKQLQSNINDESLLAADLEEKLISSSDKNEDISLIVIKISGSQFINKEQDKINQSILSCLDNNSSIYFYENDKYTILEDKTKLDDALSLAENLHTVITGKLKELSSDAKVTIGISAKTQRMISGERLLTEAVEAEKHTEADSPIIAFRVSPEKYKEFILNN